MPIYKDALILIRGNLNQLSIGQNPRWIVAGSLTNDQFMAVNQERIRLELPPVETNEILFMGRHLYNSRSKDGYTIDDIVDQIESAMSAGSIVELTIKMTAMTNPIKRADRYGNLVNDKAIFEATAKKPRMELFSVMPKGDKIKPTI